MISSIKQNICYKKYLQLQMRLYKICLACYCNKINYCTSSSPILVLLAGKQNPPATEEIHPSLYSGDCSQRGGKFFYLHVGWCSPRHLLKDSENWKSIEKPQRLPLTNVHKSNICPMTTVYTQNISPTDKCTQANICEYVKQILLHQFSLINTDWNRKWFRQCRLATSVS